MTTITIRSYKPDDHKDVNRIFAKGITDIQHIKSGLLNGYHSPYVISYLVFLFLFGCLYSIPTGINALLIGLTIHGLTVLFCYHLYVW